MAVYQEKDSTFESDGVTYDLNYIFEAVQHEPIQHINISKLVWVLVFDTKPVNKARVDRADLNVPILVTKYIGNELTVDGAHRIRKAIKEKVESLPYRRVSAAIMKAAIVQKPALESLHPSIPAYMGW